MTILSNINRIDLEHIQSTFSIKDLENFSGIKAHTIRIWEQRYDLLKPERSEGNQRLYSIEELQKLLNIKLLYENGLKISKIAGLTEEEIPERVITVLEKSRVDSRSLDDFKVAMIKFDQALFEKTFDKLMADLSFRRIFIDVFIPLLHEIGTLWQANSITPAHEHFISNLIQQKLIAQIERNIHIVPNKDERVYVLYLPYGEIHDLGLLYLHYEVMLRGLKSIYLGQSVPIENLNEVMKIYSKVTFVSYITVEPAEGMQAFIKKVEKETLTRKEDRMWIISRRASQLKPSSLPTSMRLFQGVLEAIEEIK